MAKQRKARKALGVPDPKFHGALANEENWLAYWARVEVKSGAQVRAVATRFLGAETQSDGNKSIGDPRPFIFVAMPEGWGSEGLVVMRLSAFRQLAPQ